MAFVFVGGDALGAAFGELFEAVLRSKNKVLGFGPIFKRLEFTINLITPIIKKKELDHPKEELEELIKQLKKGKEIVLQCSKASWWDPYNRAKYTKKLLELDYHITRFLTIIYEVPDPLDFTVGLDVPLKELKMRLLKDGEPPMLVLSAPGGSGKTTLVKKLCQDKEIKGKFRDNIFFVYVSETPNLKVIIKQLFQHMCSQALEFQNDGDALNRLEQLLKQRGPDPVLLVLDDVWSGSESLLEKFLFQIPDYKILVTSRSVFPRFDSTYQLKLLNDEDSMTLLCNSAFPQNGTFYVPDEDLLNEIVRRCNGNALALAVMGTLLRRQPSAVWQNVATRYGRNGAFIVDGANGRKIGDLIVSDKEIAKGSNGTVVFEGTYLGIPVAVKRLVQAHHGVASKEIQYLIETDRHQNIVRFYREEKDRDFVYLALERCTCNLADLIQIYSDHSQNTQFSDEYKVQLDSVKDIIGDINLWKANRRPLPLLIKLMRNVVSGLVHLHKKKLIHRDLKPQNVLIIKEESFPANLSDMQEGSLLAKLSDMGISKRLQQDMSSLGHQATVCGSLGWRAPEQILGGRQTRALDLFSLGCVLFFCITGGKHPFGDNHVGCDMNIKNKHKADLTAVEHIPEAVDLFSKLLVPHPESRLEALQVFHHPLLWDSTKRLSFVRDTSNRVELKDEDLLKALENIGPLTFDEQWDTKMDHAFINNILLHRSYDFKSVRDLLRVMRNKWAHYEELPKEIKEILGPDPEGFDDYFASRFPKLLIEVYEVVYQYCKEEERFNEYFKSKV